MCMVMGKSHTQCNKMACMVKACCKEQKTQGTRAMCWERAGVEGVRQRGKLGTRSKAGCWHGPAPGGRERRQRDHA